MDITAITFPLPLLPTIPDNLDTMDSRKAIRYINTFMKNTLIRGLNNIYDIAGSPGKSEAKLCSFLDYALVVCDMIRLHIEGDESFFNTPNTEGVVLTEALGKCSYMFDGGKVCKDLKVLQQKLYNWRKKPSEYSSVAVRLALEDLAHEVHRNMRKQVDSMDADVLAKSVSDKALRDMINGNLQWIANHADITYLLPFVLSHHDLETSAYWPGIGPEGKAMVPEIALVHANCWEFSPIDPVTGKAKNKK